MKETAVSVTDEEVNQTVDRLREMYAQLEVVEGRPLEKNDTAIIDFEGFREGKTIEGAKAADYMLSLGSNSLIPGFEDQIVGMNRGDTREIKVTFPADYTNKDLAGKGRNLYRHAEGDQKEGAARAERRVREGHRQQRVGR